VGVTGENNNHYICRHNSLDEAAVTQDKGSYGITHIVSAPHCTRGIAGEVM